MLLCWNVSLTVITQTNLSTFESTIVRHEIITRLLDGTDGGVRNSVVNICGLTVQRSTFVIWVCSALLQLMVGTRGPQF